ncbi:MAG TPA: hypothetical protein VGK48_21480 [Terriglobia bacterium]|jgi:hypothetical protein
MKTVWKLAGPIVLIAAFAGSGLAQWPDFHDSSVPRGPDGKPNLTAPAPKTADGKPDLSGLWQLARPPAGQRGQRGQGQGTPGAPGARGAQAAAPPASPAPPAPQAATPGGTPPVSSFKSIGAGMAGGLPLQPWAADLVKKRLADNDKDNPDAHCLPMGFMQFHNHPEPRKIVQTPQAMYIIYEANSGLRQIYMDGRKVPGKDADPWWYGYSVGHWEGDTLVVETTGFRDGLWLDIDGNPLTDQAKVTERFRRPNFGTLEIDVTIDDPKAYTHPFTVRVNQRIMVDTDLIEFICEDRDATHYVGAK